MFDLLPFRKRNEDAFGRMLQAFYDAFDEDFPSLRERANSFRTDIEETNKAYYIEAELPGFSKEDITIEVDNNYLIIRAKRDQKEEVKDKKSKMVRQERYFGEFVRQFYVDNIKEDEIKAKLEDGILKIEIPKQVIDDSPRKRIEIE